MTDKINFNYGIHYTGSKGNSASIYYDELGFLIDIGKPYKYIEPLLYDKSFILITHIHGDHIKWTTYKKIREDFPHIKILANNEVNEELLKRKLKPVDVIFSDNLQFTIGDVKFTCLQNYHGAGVERADTQGFILESPHETLLFATDLSTTIEYSDYLEKNNLKLDVILLEGNYREEVIEFYEMRGHTGFDIFNNGSYRHLAISEFEEFVEKWKKPDARIKMLHTSDTYGSFEGLLNKSQGKLTEEDVKEWRSKK